MSRDQRLGLRGGLATGPIRIGLPADVTAENDTPRPTSRPKPRKVGSTVNTLVEDEETAADRPVAARTTTPVEVEAMAKTAAPKPEVKTPEPKARKSRAKPKTEPVAVPPPMTVIPPEPPPPPYVPQAEPQATIRFAQVYSALVQRRVSIIATAVTLCVVIALGGFVTLLAGPIVALCAMGIAFFFGLGIQKAVKAGLNKYLSIGLMRKAVGFVFGVAVAGMCMLVGLFIVALPIMLLLIAAVGLHSLLLEYRIAQMGVGTVEVLETTTEAVGTGGFDAPSVPAAKKCDEDGD